MVDRLNQGATNCQSADAVANILHQANHMMYFLFLLQSIWKRFFTEDGGPGVSLCEADFSPSEKHSKCAEKFLQNNTDTCDGMYLVSILDSLSPVMSCLSKELQFKTVMHDG